MVMKNGNIVGSGKHNDLLQKSKDYANLYNKHLNQDIHKPYFSKKGDHIYYTYTILTKNRDKVKKYLTKNESSFSSIK